MSFNAQEAICKAFGFKKMLDTKLFVYKTKYATIRKQDLSAKVIEKLAQNNGKELELEMPVEVRYECVLYYPSKLKEPINENRHFHFSSKDEAVFAIDNVMSNVNKLEVEAEQIAEILDNQNKDEFTIVVSFENKPLFSTKETKTLQIATDNTQTPCAMCGKIHDKGYIAKDAESLLQAVIPDTYNECYALRAENFVCEHCMFSLKAYASPSKTLYGKKIVNVLIHDGKADAKSFSSDEENELYDLMKKPPEPPFVILINSRGTVLENLVFAAKPTISKGLFAVNYGINTLEVSPSEVFAAIEEAAIISARYGIEITSDSIWNRADDVSIGMKYKGKKGVINAADFIGDMGLFLNKYNRDCRIVSKMILAAYLKKHERPSTKRDNALDAKNVAGNTPASSLFDF